MAIILNRGKITAGIIYGIVYLSILFWTTLYLKNDILQVSVSILKYISSGEYIYGTPSK